MPPSEARHKIDPPFRADHVGSLLRPQAILDAREAFDGPEFDPTRKRPKPDSLVALEDAHVREAIALQERVGLKAVTDGDYRRRSWFLDFMVQLEGLCVGWSSDGIVFRSAEGTTRPTPRLVVERKLRWPEGGICVDAYRFLAEHTKAMPKITIPTPLQAENYGIRFETDAYPDPASFWDEMIECYHAELRALRDAGCTYVQIDECTLIKLCDPRFREMFRAQGKDPEQLKIFFIDVLRRVCAGKPDGMMLAMHICRGNSRGHWSTEGEYEPIADVVFSELGFDAYFLEYDTPRAGDFRPLRHVPADKIVVLGLVTTKSPELETRDALMRRIDEASRFVPLDRLCLSPQCGFASSKFGNPVTPEDQEAKLRLVVETAAQVWG